MTVGFLGAGNMGGALAKAAAKAVGGEHLRLCDVNTEKAAALAAELSAVAVDLPTLLADSDYIFLGVKPQVLAAALEPLAGGLRPEQVLISMAAAVPLERVVALTGQVCPVIRIMPNTPVAVGQGMVLYTPGDTVTPAQEAAFCDILAAAGRLCKIPEPLMDAGSAVSGCGPAFAYLFIEALADGGVECGLPREQALSLAAQTVLGAAQMVLDTGKHPGMLKDAVCSPGGTTIAGVHALENGGFRSLAMDAVGAAYNRTLELAGKA